MRDKGYQLDIVEFDDYILPNLNVESGELDANFFQHRPYLENFNEENDTHLVSVAVVHYEPFGLYPGKTTSLENLKDNAQIAIPNDGTNEREHCFCWNPSVDYTERWCGNHCDEFWTLQKIPKSSNH